jgi:hypothetical protein
MFGIVFVFFILFVYCGISIISNLVFGFLEWRIKRRYVNEMLKELAVLPLQWKEEKLQKWYVLLAIIVCGLIWMPSFAPVMDVGNDVNMDYDIDTVIANDVDNVIKIEEPLSISEKYGIPEPYYFEVAEKENISELREVLKGIKHPHSYEECVFDCSEMSAYTEWFLENNGFNTSILANGSWGHAWISCSVEGSNVNIECIPPVHIASSERYNHPEYIYVDIFEALDSNYPWEFDWWSK